MLSRRPVNRNSPIGFGQTVPIPSAVGGWNARDPLAAMPPTDAIRLINWFPEAADLEVRPGKTAHATGVGASAVETVVQWRGPASSKLLAAGDGKIYDATVAGAATNISAASAFANDRWQTAPFNGRIFGVNGADAPWDYDGTTFTATAWTSVTVTDLVNVAAIHERLFFCVNDSADFEYGAVGAVTGALVNFPLSQVARHGGFLMAIGDWTRDSGDGMDDLTVFVMSSGEIIIYQGFDPAAALTWSRVGSFVAAEPIGRQCLVKVGGDLVLISRQGYIPISHIMQGWSVDRIHRETTWGKIAPAVIDAAVAYAANTGWQSYVSPDGKKLIVNIPVTAIEFEQHVMNIQTGAWTQYTGLNGSAFGDYDGEIYIGGPTGEVFKHVGTSDDGVAITFRAKQAFNYFGSASTMKQWTGARAVVASDGVFSAAFTIDVDFSDSNAPLNRIEYFSTATGSAWDEDDWDVATWAGDVSIQSKWVDIAGIGRAAAVRFDGSTVGSVVRWFSTDFLGVLGGSR